MVRQVEIKYKLRKIPSNDIQPLHHLTLTNYINVPKSSKTITIDKISENSFR